MTTCRVRTELGGAPARGIAGLLILPYNPDKGWLATEDEE
jgi:hypothetical protein